VFEQNLNRELDSRDLRESKWHDVYDEAYSESDAAALVFNLDHCCESLITELSEMFEVKPFSPGVPNDVIGAKLRQIIKEAAHEVAATAAEEAASKGFQD
jgi:hypothetical protein